MQDRPFRFDAAPIRRQVERLARQPSAGSAARRVGTPVQPRLWRIAFEIEVEPCVLLRVEPRFGGCQDQRGVGGDDELELSVIEKFVAQSQPGPREWTVAIGDADGFPLRRTT